MAIDACGGGAKLCLDHDGPARLLAEPAFKQRTGEEQAAAGWPGRRKQQAGSGRCGGAGYDGER